MGKYEVTDAHYNAFMRAGNYDGSDDADSPYLSDFGSPPRGPFALLDKMFFGK